MLSNMSVISKRLLFVIIAAAVVVESPRQLNALRFVHNKDPQQVVNTETEGKLKQTYYKVILGTDPIRETTRLELARLQGRTQLRLTGPFPCVYPRSFRSQRRPTSVHKLMPGDVDVVAAMGDSLTAGMGATAITPFMSLIENRGFSSFIGGYGNWRDYLTLPNILRVYNPHLVGYSTGDGTTVDSSSGFNVGEAGALSHQMPYQARILVERIKRDRRVDFQGDWKLVSLMIGNNDICSEMCYWKDPAQIVDSHYWGVRKALDYLRDHLPRTFVNVVPMLNVPLLSKLDFPISCYVTQSVFCSCIFGPKFDANKDLYIDIGYRLQKATVDAVRDGGYGWKYKSFAAVTQPYLYNQMDRFIPSASNNFSGRSILRVTAPDCFHYNQLGYAIAANALWNNMLSPEGSKLDHESDNPMESCLCPTREHPYFFTIRNSRHR